MTSAPASSSPLRRALLALMLAFALLSRVAAPAGWMPAAGGAGLMLCPEAGPAVHAAPKHHGHGAPAKSNYPDGERGPCAFAAASLAIDVAPPLAGPALPLAIVTDAPASLLPVVPGRGLAAPPPFATGPPLRA